MGRCVMESREDCLHEASECDRLAQLANTQGTRTLLAVAAFQWRKLAERQRSGKGVPAIGAGNDKYCGCWRLSGLPLCGVLARIVATTGRSISSQLSHAERAETVS
jgi:hypothetical protein